MMHAKLAEPNATMLLVLGSVLATSVLLFITWHTQTPSGLDSLAVWMISHQNSASLSARAADNPRLGNSDPLPLTVPVGVNYSHQDIKNKDHRDFRSGDDVDPDASYHPLREFDLQEPLRVYMYPLPRQANIDLLLAVRFSECISTACTQHTEP